MKMNWLWTTQKQPTYKLVYNALRSKHKRESSFSVSIDNNVIKKATAAKYLGIIIEPTLKWNLQIQSLSTKLSKVAGIISKIRRYVDTPTLRLIYFSLVHSHILYGILSWGSAYGITLNSLRILQNKIEKN